MAKRRAWTGWRALWFRECQHHVTHRDNRRQETSFDADEPSVTPSPAASQNERRNKYAAPDLKRYNPYLRRFYERIESRRGSGRAIIATARKFLGIIYNTLVNDLRRE